MNVDTIFLLSSTSLYLSCCSLVLFISVMLKLVLSSSMDAMLEATRVYGNMSQSKDVRDFIMQNKGLWLTQTHTNMQKRSTWEYYMFCLSCILFLLLERKGGREEIHFKSSCRDAYILSKHVMQQKTKSLDTTPCTLCTFTYCHVMFRLQLSARPATVSINMLADWW